MNTTKKLLILCMALVMCICCIAPSFSWYDRNGAQADKTAMQYTRSALPASGALADNTKLTMTTYKGTLDANNEVKYDETADGVVNSEAITATAGDGTNYATTCYKTVIKNTSAKDVRVGLYLESADFGSGTDDICFGTSDPLWRRVSSETMNTAAQKETAAANTMRVYYQKQVGSADPVWTENEFFVNARSNEYNLKTYKMTSCSLDPNYYYADIPADSTHFFIACTESEYVDYQRTNEVVVADCGLSKAQSVAVHLTAGEMTNGTIGNMKAFYENYAGTNIIKHYSSLNLATTGLGKTGSLALTANEHYTGTSIAYSSDNTGVATVDANGEVTGAGAGTAVITTTVTGAKGDAYSVKTTVNVQDPAQTLPLMQNILVPKSGEAAVCWYIDNKTTNAISNLKLMLTL